MPQSGVRNHYSITIDEFNGLFKRDDNDEACPIDHFRDCLNIQSQDKTFRTRDGIDTIPGPGDIIRAYKYKSPTLGEGILALDVNGDFWHQTYGPDVTNGPILSIPGVTDFVFVDIASRASIS